MPGHTAEARFRNKLRRQKAKALKAKLDKEAFMEAKKASMDKSNKSKVKQRLVPVKQKKTKVTHR